MNGRYTVFALLALGAAPLASLAQQQGKVWHIGILETTSLALNATNLDAFRQGLPVERPDRYELVVNLATAKSLRFAIPPSILLRADQVIE